MSANALERFCDEIADSLAASDQQRFVAAARALAMATPQAAPDDVQDALAQLAGILATIPLGRGADLARLAGAMTGSRPAAQGTAAGSSAARDRGNGARSPVHRGPRR